jgi:glycosyltransferase involved in cell wall biosynthesis
LHPPGSVLFPFIGDSVGGAQLSALLLIEGLEKENVRTDVVVHEEGPLSQHLEQIGRRYEIFPLPGYVGRAPSLTGNIELLIKAGTRIRKIIREQRWDIVHAHDSRTNMTWVLPTRFSGKKFVWHQRSRFSASRLQGLLVRPADAVVSISDYIKHALPDTVRHESTVVANPFDTGRPVPDRSVARAQLLEELNLPANSRLVAAVGNMTSQKRPEFLVDVAAEVMGQVVDPVYFVVFGRIPDNLQSQLMDRAGKRDIAENLVFAGFRYPVEPCIAGSDVLVSAAIKEGFGRSLVEAHLTGTPVVATNSGGHSEIIETGLNGIMPQDDNPADFARSVCRLLESPALSHELATNARKKAVHLYSIEEHTRRIRSIYNGIR